MPFQELFYVLHQRPHFGTKKIKSDLDGLFPAALFVGSSHFFSLLIRKQGQGNRTRHVGMIVFTWRPDIQGQMRFRTL
jgi:hypothetical protein